MNDSVFSTRASEHPGDMAAWLRAHAETNDSQLRRVRRNLKRAIQEDLTERQRTMLLMRYSQGFSMARIAKELGVNRSTVSRTLARANKRLERALKYSF